MVHLDHGGVFRDQVGHSVLRWVDSSTARALRQRLGTFDVDGMLRTWVRHLEHRQAAMFMLEDHLRPRLGVIKE